MSEILPLELVDKSIGKEVRILLKSDKEFLGTLVGFDDFVNCVVRDVTEINGGVIVNKVDEMLLNGNSIVMIVPLS